MKIDILEQVEKYINSNVKSEGDSTTIFKRMEKYKTIQKNVREKLKIAYGLSTNKVKFYSIVFEILYEFESDYLFTNLLLENNCVSLINDLNRENSFPTRDILFNSNLALNFAKFCTRKGEELSRQNFENFIKNHFIKIVDNIQEGDWNSINERNHPVLKKYSEFLTECFTTNRSINAIDSFILFIKIWNDTSAINKRFFFNNIKAIVFYNSINKVLEDQQVSQKHYFFEFIQSLELIVNSLFIKKKYIPLLDNKESKSLNEGYKIQRELLLKNIDIAKKVNAIYLEERYSDLLRKMNNTDEEILIQKYKKIITEKILRKHLLKKHEKGIVSDLKLSGRSKQMRKELFERFYFFEDL